MQARRRILFAVVALALPLTGFAVFGTPSIFAGAAQPEYPVACNVSGTVTFTPALTMTGTRTTNPAAVTTVSISAGKLAACLSAAPDEAPNRGDLPAAPLPTFTIPATKLAPRSYATGYCPGFDLAAIKALKGFKFDVTWTQGTGGTSDFTTTKAASATNKDSEVGFSLAGKEAADNPYFEKSLNQVTLFIDAADSAILSSGCSADQTVSTVTFDKNNSVAIL